MSRELTDHLQSELARIAERAPDLDLPGDAWRRGQRLRRRDRVATVAAAVVTCAAIAGLVVTITTPHQVSPIQQPAGPAGVPARVWAVPDRLVQNRENVGNEKTWDPRVAESELAIGRGAVAFTVGAGGALPVVVTAADGAYHALDLPGFVEAGLINSGSGSSSVLETSALALSPDGDELAFGWWKPDAPLGSPMPAGIRILELDTGGITTIPLRGGNGIRVRSLDWSPDGRWLAWTGDRTASWTPSSSGNGDLVAGRVTPADEVQVRPGKLSSDASPAISSSGLLAIQDRDRLTLWDGGQVSRGPVTRDDNPGSPAAWSPAGDVVADAHQSGRAFSVTDPATGRMSTGDLPSETASREAASRPVGWIDDDHLVLYVSPSPGDGNGAAQRRLVVATRVGEREWSSRVVGQVDATVHGDLSVAVDLMSQAVPTVARPEPPWPWSTERKWTVGLLAGCLAGAVITLVRRRRLR